MSQKTYKSVSELGDAMASLFAAFIPKNWRSDLGVCLIDSDEITMKGVWEETTRISGVFLLRNLGYRVSDFFKQVMSIWNQGVRFEKDLFRRLLRHIEEQPRLIERYIQND